MYPGFNYKNGWENEHVMFSVSNEGGRVCLKIWGPPTYRKEVRITWQERVMGVHYRAREMNFAGYTWKGNSAQVHAQTLQSPKDEMGAFILMKGERLFQRQL